MGRLLIFISFLTLALNGLSQDKQLKVDTFQKVDGFVSSYLLICSDTTFFVAFGNCTEANISKGKWKKANGKLTLIPERGDKLVVKPFIENKVLSKDTNTTFKVVDYFNTPIENYAVIFYDSNMKEYDYFTDASGKLQVPKNRFVAYMTIDEYNKMDVGSDVANTVHFLWNGFSDISLILNYPKQILRQRLNVYPFRYEGDTFIRTSKGLSSLKTGLTLKSL